MFCSAGYISKRFLSENAEFIVNSGGLSALMDDLVLGTLLIARCCSAPSRYFIYQNTSLYMVVSEIIPLCRPMSCLSDDVVYIYLGNGV